MNYTKVLKHIIVVSICLVLLSMVGMSTPSESFSAGRSVVLYSANKQSAIDLSVKMFKEKHPDISVSVVRAGSGALMKRIAAEKDNPLGDVFWSGGFGLLGAYKEYFAPYSSPEAKATPAEFIEPNNLWTGVNVHVMVIMYNLKLVNKNELPKKWSDLFDPKWKDKVVMGDPSKSSSTYLQTFGIHKLYGKEGLRKLARVVRNVPSTSMVYKGVAMGEYPLGITMEYAAYSYVAGGAKEVGLIYPEDRSFLSPEGVVLIKGAKHPEEAKLFYDFYCSKDGQEALFKQAFRRPTRRDIEVEKLTKLPQFDSIKLIDIDQAKASDDYKKITKMWDEIKKGLRR